MDTSNVKINDEHLQITVTYQLGKLHAKKLGGGGGGVVMKTLIININRPPGKNGGTRSKNHSVHSIELCSSCIKFSCSASSLFFFLLGMWSWCLKKNFFYIML